MDKVCKDCHKVKDAKEFYISQNDCKDCYRARVKTQKERLGLPRKCVECKKDFKALNSEIKRGGGITCSRTCYYTRLRKLLDDKFKEKTTYATIHKWIYKKLGKASKCEVCDTKDSEYYHWSNKSGEYRQDVDDWWQLCPKCHHAYDDSSTKMWVTRKKKYTNGFKPK